MTPMWRSLKELRCAIGLPRRNRADLKVLWRQEYSPFYLVTRAATRSSLASNRIPRLPEVDFLFLSRGHGSPTYTQHRQATRAHEELYFRRLSLNLCREIAAKETFNLDLAPRGCPPSIESKGR